MEVQYSIHTHLPKQHKSIKIGEYEDYLLVSFFYDHFLFSIFINLIK